MDGWEVADNSTQATKTIHLPIYIPVKFAVYLLSARTAATAISKRLSTARNMQKKRNFEKAVRHMATERKGREKLFVLYDARARNTKPGELINGDIEPTVFDTAGDEREARSLRGEYPSDSIWAEYDIEADGKTLTNEKLRWDIQA